MSAPPPVRLQINLAHSDLEEATHVLPHQLRQWGGQVAEILCVLDQPGRDATGEAFLRLMQLREFIASHRPAYPHLRTQEVDYSTAAAREISDMLLGGRHVPRRDYRGRPIHSYPYGLVAAKHDLIFHLDADMIFGGGSQTWMEEAVEILEHRTDLLACKPLPGPPRADGRLTGQKRPPMSDPRGLGFYRFDTFSTRLFLINRRHFSTRLDGLEMTWAPMKSAIRAMLAGRSPYDLVEPSVTREMARESLYRLDFLGREPGCGRCTRSIARRRASRSCRR
jgi:hypothetical protein